MERTTLAVNQEVEIMKTHLTKIAIDISESPVIETFPEKEHHSWVASLVEEFGDCLFRWCNFSFVCNKRIVVRIIIILMVFESLDPRHGRCGS